MTGSVNINDSATPKLRKFLEAAGAKLRSRLNRHIGAAVQNLIRNHFLKLQSSRHESAERVGGTPTNYWGKAAESVSLPAAVRADEIAAVVAINAPGIGRVDHDVTIKAGTQTPGVEYLTIPIAAESYGNRIFQGEEGRFEGGFFFKSKKGNLLYGVREGKGIHPLYLLKPEVTLKQDRSLLPSDQEILDAAMASLKQDLQSLLGETDAEINRREAA